MLFTKVDKCILLFVLLIQKFENDEQKYFEKIYLNI